MRNILFHHGALGDTVLLWPLLRALGQVTLVASRAKAQLTAHCLANVTAIDADGPAFTRLFAADAERDIDNATRELLRHADCIISFVSDGHDVWAKNVRAIAPDVSLHFVSPRLPADTTQHITEYHQHQLAGQGLSVDLVHPSRRTLRGGPILMHPGSGGEHKCYPRKRFQTILDQLIAHGAEVAVLFGEAERERWPSDVLDRWQSDYAICTPGSLIALADHIGRASVYIGNDAGPTHLAGQLGMPTIALFGPTDPRVWAPQGPCVQVIQPETDGDWANVNDVIRIVGQTHHMQLA